MKITKLQLKQIIKEEISESQSWERFEFDVDHQGEHTRTRRSDRQKEQRRWEKMQQEKAARDRWQEEDPEGYQAWLDQKQREREDFLATSKARNKSVVIGVLKDLIRNGTPPGAIVSNPGYVKIAVDELAEEQEQSEI